MIPEAFSSRRRSGSDEPGTFRPISGVYALGGTVADLQFFFVAHGRSPIAGLKRLDPGAIFSARRVRRVFAGRWIRGAGFRCIMLPLSIQSACR